MQRYSSKTLTLSYVCNLVFIKTCWGQSKSKCFRLIFKIQAGLKLLAPLLWLLVSIDKSNCCTPCNCWSNKPVRLAVCHQELKTQYISTHLGSSDTTLDCSVQPSFSISSSDLIFHLKFTASLPPHPASFPASQAAQHLPRLFVPQFLWSHLSDGQSSYFCPSKLMF